MCTDVFIESPLFIENTVTVIKDTSEFHAYYTAGCQ